MPFHLFGGFLFRLIGLMGFQTFHAVSSVWWIFIPFNLLDGFFRLLATVNDNANAWQVSCNWC
jgi:hypothetical protein